MTRWLKESMATWMEIRDILFPHERGLVTGTPLNPSLLYDPIIKAFDKTLAKMEANTTSIGD
ncbi:hypothetical protein F4861DRAFT_107205 [Xylaria intraflava]|nr:hypothetical protein F4861DRAFT_107205 [Xylaria intraflava]